MNKTLNCNYAVMVSRISDQCKSMAFPSLLMVIVGIFAAGMIHPAIGALIAGLGIGTFAGAFIVQQRASMRIGSFSGIEKEEVAAD